MVGCSWQVRKKQYRLCRMVCHSIVCDVYFIGLDSYPAAKELGHSLFSAHRVLC